MSALAGGDGAPKPAVEVGPRVPPLSEHDPPFHDPALAEIVRTFGYRPNALLTMARRPGLLPPIFELLRIVLWSEGIVPVELRMLLACEASRGAGCAYTATHMVHAAHHAGVDWDKLAALPEYGTHPLFSDCERRAMALATAGSTLPVSEMRQTDVPLSEDEVIEIVSVLAAFGWFNRWNSLMRTEIELVPAEAIVHVPWLAALAAGPMRIP